MDYFTQLLESYDLIKKRKFKLRIDEEINPEAEQKAQQAIQAARNYMKEGKGAYQVPGMQLYIYVTKEGRVSYSPKARPPNPQTGYVGLDSFKYAMEGNGSPGKDYEEFINYFDSSQPQADLGNTPQSQMQMAMQPGMPQIPAWQATLGIEDPNRMDHISQLTSKISKIASELYDKFLKGNIARTITLNDFLAGLTSDKNGALLAKMTNTSVFSTTPEGKLQISIAGTDPVLFEQCLTTLSEVFSLAEEDNIGEGDLAFLSSVIAVDSKDRIIVYSSKGSDEGLVLAGKNTELRGILDDLKKRHGAKFPSIELQFANAGLDNVIRGTSLEKIPSLLVISRQLNEARKLGDIKRAKVLEKTMKELYDEFKFDLDSLRRVHSSWVKSNEVAALSVEDLPIIEALEKLFGDDSKKYLAAIYNISKSLVQEHKPDLVIPIGASVGYGKRADTAEIYRTEQDVMRALERMGISYEEAIKNGVIKKVSRKDLDPKYRKLLSEGEEYFEINIGLKRYFELDKVTLGRGSEGEFGAFLEGSKSEYDEFVQSTRDTFGITDGDWSEIFNLHSAAEAAAKRIRELAGPKLTNVAGKNIETDVTKTLIKLFKDTIRGDSAWDDFNPQGDRGRTVKSKINGLIDRYYKNTKNKEVQNEIVTLIAALSKNAYMEREIQKGSRAARVHLALKMMHAGGSFSNGELLNAVGLKNRESFTCVHNDLLREPLMDFINNSGNWEFISTGDRMRIVNKANRKQHITLILRTKGSEKSKLGFSTESVVHISREWLKAKSRKSTRESKDHTENLIDSFLENQKTILMELFNIQTKNSEAYAVAGSPKLL